MKKSVLGLTLATLAAGMLLGSCGKAADANVLNIQCWNEEFRGFFNRYSTDEGKALLKEGKLMDDEAKKAKEGYHVDGVPVKFVETPSTDGAYQKALDNALEGNAGKKAADKVDMFLAEADYILKYANSAVTQDIDTLTNTKIDQSHVYNYTKQAASDASGHVKGISFQCCPSGLIYNRTIAKDMFGTDDPEVVQTKVDSWEKFETLGDQLKEKNAHYKLTASFAETYRVFSNNVKAPWVNSANELSIPAEVVTWMDQAEDLVTKGETVTDGIWDAGKTALIKKDPKAEDDKAFCCFGPAWYYNFCMGDSKAGDWAVIKGPQSHFWGGTWLMAASGTDNGDLVAKIMDQYINDAGTMQALIKNENQFTNNQVENQKAADAGHANAFLGGQNDTALFCEAAKSIKFENVTAYDQYCNEGLQNKYQEYLVSLKTGNGKVTREQAINNFKTSMKEQFPKLIIK